MEHLRPDQFEGLLSKGNKTLIMFYAEWCPFCKRFKPTFESLANSTLHNIKFYASMINDDDNPLWDKYSINTVPTLIAFYKNEIIARKDSELGRGLDKSDIDSILKEISQ